jgi:hypothetical protein
MLSAEAIFSEMIESPVRRTKARIEVLEGSELVDVCKSSEGLQSITVDRVGDGAKFYGFGICHKLNAKITDTERQRQLSTANALDVAFGVGADYVRPFPYFHITDVYRDEKSNQLSITAYDALYSASEHTISELGSDGYTLQELASVCAGLLGASMQIIGVNDDVFDTFYSEGANFSGTETIREVLDAIAEATQTIYYLDSECVLTFKRLDLSGAAALTIDRSKYFTLDSGENRRLSAISHVTELGDNVIAKMSVAGTTQYIRNNPLYELRDDIGVLLENALAAVGGLTINQFECSWRGNYLLEIGDKIALTTKDGKTVFSYLLDDTISYNGALSEKTRWKYTGSDSENDASPVNLGEVLKQTHAKVDKANREISLLASETAANGERLASLLINTESISASVQEVQEETTAALDGVNESISTLANRVNAAITAEQMRVTIQEEIANGTHKVVTETGFTFDNEGLTVSKSGSEMSTQITDNGMIVSKDGETVLTANNVGVDAVNLHATTYLIIGTNSRFENYGADRTGCFWIGG